VTRVKLAFEYNIEGRRCEINSVSEECSATMDNRDVQARRDPCLTSLLSRALRVSASGIYPFPRIHILLIPQDAICRSMASPEPSHLPRDADQRREEEGEGEGGGGNSIASQARTGFSNVTRNK